MYSRIGPIVQIKREVYPFHVGEHCRLGTRVVTSKARPFKMLAYASKGNGQSTSWSSVYLAMIWQL